MRTFSLSPLDNAPDRGAQRRLVPGAKIAMRSHTEHEWQASSQAVRYAGIGLHGVMLPATL